MEIVPYSPALKSARSAWHEALPADAGNPAQEAYDEAVEIFKAKFTKDECKKIWLQGITSIQDVQNSLLIAKERYDQTSSSHSKVRKWLNKASERLIFYGKIFDTFSNCNPEYLGLAWGSMKFLLMTILNHEELVTQLAKALSQIAIILPRVDLKLELYQTTQIKLAVSTLYSHLIKFFIRAMNWYTEGKFRHVVSAIFRPMPLRFEDILENIKTCSENVEQLATSAYQAEQRDIHILLLEIKRTMTENQAANSRLFLDSNRRVCEIQFSQILTFVATTSLPNPEQTYRHSAFLSRRRRFRTPDFHPSWHSHKLKVWASSSGSSLILVKGNCLTRHETKDFGADIVALLRSLKVPVIWTLNAKEKGDLEKRSPLDVLKQLVFQILQLNHYSLKELSVNLNPALFQSAMTEVDWFVILRLVLIGLSKLYIVVDTEVLKQEFSSELSWPEEFLRIFDELKQSSCKTVLKVVLVSSTNTPYLLYDKAVVVEDMIIRIDRNKNVRGAVARKQRYRPVTRRHGPEILKPFLLNAATSPI